jgi:hypothetical protein
VKGIVLAAAWAVAGSASLASELEWGVNGHPITAYPGVSIEDQLDLVGELGMTSYRVNVSHAEHASALADVVEAATARGITILPVLTPGLDLDSGTPESLSRAAREFAHALASRFGDAVPVWELGNELENYAIIQPCERRDDGATYPCEWGPAGGVDALDYYGARWAKVSAVLKGLSEGVNAADPDLLTAMGTAGWGHVGAFERMRADGIDWDISVWHLYGDDPEWAFEILAEYARPIWVTEVNHPYGSQNGEEAQADGLRRIMARLAELSDRYDVEAAHVYQLLDEPYWAPSFEAVMGLVTMKQVGDGAWVPDERKPAFHAVADAIAALAPAGGCEAETLSASADPAVRMAASAHCRLLGRSATGLELMRWMTALRRGDEPTALYAELLRAPEFQTRLLDALKPAEIVALVFRTMLDREPDGQGLDAYAAQLADGSLDRDGLLIATLLSSEFARLHPDLFVESAARRAPASDDCGPGIPDDAGAAPARRVAEAYCLILERPPQVDETARWSAALASDPEGAMRLLDALVDTPEFARRHGTATITDAAYVGLIYRLMLGREADGQGLADYTAQLSSGSMTRPDFAKAMVRSAEFRARRAALIVGAPRQTRDCDLAAEAGRALAHERRAAYAHCLVLGEPPDPAHLRLWSESMADGKLRAAQLVEALVASPQFAERRGTATMSDKEYLDLVYRVLLLREADGASRDAYLARIARGEIRREDVAMDAIASAEFAARHEALAE